MRIRFLKGGRWGGFWIYIRNDYNGGRVDIFFIEIEEKKMNFDGGRGVCVVLVYWYFFKGFYFFLGFGVGRFLDDGL